MRGDNKYYLIGTLADAAYTASKLDPAELDEALETARSEIAKHMPEAWAALARAFRAQEEVAASIKCAGCGDEIHPQCDGPGVPADTPDTERTWFDSAGDPTCWANNNGPHHVPAGEVA